MINFSLQNNPLNKHQTSWTWYILLFLYIVHLAQGLIFQNDSILGQVSILFILMVGIIDYLRTLFMNQTIPTGLKWVSVLLIVLVIYYILSPKIIHSTGYLYNLETYNQLKEIISYFVPIYIGFQIGLHKRITEKQWLIITVMILTLAIIVFIQNKIRVLELKKLGESTNNAGYIFIMIIPFLPLIVKKYKTATLSLLVIVFIYAMIAAKRGAILCMAIMLLYLLKWYMGRNLNLKTFILISVMVIAGILGIQYFLSENDYLYERFQLTIEGDSSGRDYIYEKLWAAWINADEIIKIFGRGSAQTVSIIGNYAHNDWLEFLTNNGLIGVILYLGTIISIFRFHSHFSPHSAMRCSYNLVMLMWIIKSIFSMGMGVATGITMMLIGTLMGNYYFSQRNQ